MSQNENVNLSRPGINPARQYLSAIWEYRTLWMFSMAVCTILGVMFALFAPKSYVADQTLVIRDARVGTMFKPGRFDSMESLKSAQESILEISRRPHVICKALRQLGPPAGTPGGRWPSDWAIEQIQGKITISAPNNAEFGETEALVLSVQESSKQRAARFIEFLLDEIETSLREFRAVRFKSLEEELTQSTLVAKHAYESAAAKLQTLENQFGMDLGIIRSLNDSSTVSNLPAAAWTGLMAERRSARTDVDRAQQQLDLLLEAQSDPTRAVGVSREFLQQQPTIASLIYGRNAALLKALKHASRYSVNHPMVHNDQREIANIESTMRRELGASIHDLKSQLAMRTQRFEQLDTQVKDYERRLEIAGNQRVEYQILTDDVNKKREIFSKSEAELSEIQSLGAAAYNVSLVTRIDGPQVGFHPVGATNRTIVFGSMAGGLLIGLGLVMLIAPIDMDQPQLFSTEAVDYLPTVAVPVPPAAEQSVTGTRRSSGRKPPAAVADSPKPAEPAEFTPPMSQIANQTQAPNVVADLPEKSAVSETALTAELPVANFATEATKAMVNEISTRLQIDKQDDPPAGGSPESEYSKSETGLQTVADSVPADTPVAESATSPRVQKPDPDSLAVPSRPTSITEPRSSMRTEEITNPTSSDAEEDLIQAFTADLPSETSTPESSDKHGVQKGQLPKRQYNPQYRPMAKTVDLRELKKQLSGKSKRHKKEANTGIADKIRVCDVDHAATKSATRSGTDRKESTQPLDHVAKSISEKLNLIDDALSDSIQDKSDSSSDE